VDALRQNPQAAGIDDATIQKAIELAIARGLEQADAPQDPYTVDSSIVVVLVAVAAIVAAITVVLAQSYAATLNIATAVNVAVVVVAWTWVYATTGGGGDGKRRKAITRLPLSREQMVDSIVLALGN
jgi:ribosomal protein S12 methylthiotransferase accessory factor YcaO